MLFTVSKTTLEPKFYICNIEFNIRNIDVFIPLVRATAAGSTPAPANWTGARAAPGPGWPHSG